MQQTFEFNHDIDKAAGELRRLLPIAALCSIVSERRRQHKPSAELALYLQRAVTAELIREYAS